MKLSRSIISFLILALAFAFFGCGQDRNIKETSLEEAWLRYQQGEFDSAISVFDDLLKRAEPGSELELQSLYGKATCWNYRRNGRDAGKANAIYEDLIKRLDSSHPLKPWCVFDIVRAKHLEPTESEPDFAALAKQYRKVFVEFPDSIAGQEANYCALALNLAIESEDPNEIARQIDSELQRQPDSIEYPRLLELKAACFKKMGKERERVGILIESLQRKEMRRKGLREDFSGLIWSIAYVSEFGLGDFDLAAVYYRKLISDYPRDSRVFAAEKALERMKTVRKLLEEGKALPPDLLTQGRPQ